jgi:signal transduction histidine kinase/ligand-binding sensor domain-containing protein
MIVFAAALLCGAGSSSAANEATTEFALETWMTEHGMPQNSVTALLQTRAGYIWAATYNGIAQFDGERFKVFDSSSTKGLPNSRITSLFEDPSGDIWIGHDTGDLTRFSGGTFHSEPMRGKWFVGTISGICADAGGDVWVLNIRGQAQRHRDGMVLEPPPEMAEFPSLVPQLMLDGQHRLLMVRNGYVAEITPGGIRRIEFKNPEARPYYACVTPARQGGLWVPGDGRVRRWAEQAWQQDLGPYPWGDAFVMTMMESSAGHLLVGTLERGLFIYSPTLGWMNLNRTNGLPQDWIRCLAEDREHNLWVGNSGGLVVLRPRSVVMLSPPDAWQGRPVLAITQASDGAVWAATEGAGLYRFKDDSWKHYGVESGLSNSFVWSVLEDSRGRIWAGTWGGGLFRLENDRFVRQFDLHERGEAVTALKEFPAGTLWIGTVVGLMRWSSNTLERFAPLGGAMAGDIRSLATGRDGQLWIGTQGSGLGRYQNGQFFSTRQTDGLPRDFILSLYEDEDRTLWIGTLDRGVCRYRDGQYAKHIITTEHGLPNNVIGDMEDDGLGNLWLNTQRGLVRASKNDLNACADGKISTLPTLVFGKGDGLATLAGSSGFTPSGFRAPDGRLWFPTAKGLAVVNPKSIHTNAVPPSVWIEEILVDGQHAEILAAAPPPGTRKDLDLPSRAVELKPGRRQLDVLFTGVSFTSPERVRFKYRLEGLDTEWTDGGTRRRVTYPLLPPGEYAFRVIACNSDGLWNQTGDTVAIKVLPYFWQTWWFKTALAIVGTSVVGNIFFLESRRRLRRKLERIARERELERERARIAQDIHDDLGASLTRIGMLSQSASEDLLDPPRAAASLGQIYSTARDLTGAMDEIVWAVNPRHDTLDSLTNYIARFAHDFLSAAHIRCRLDAPMSVPDLTVRSEVRHNLFLAFKETLNNVVKHSRASEVRVTLELAPGGFNLIVADNGTGFDPDKSPGYRATGRVVSGYGLAGIGTRLEQIGGRMKILSQPAEGTRVELFVPLPEIVRAEHSR